MEKHETIPRRVTDLMEKTQDDSCPFLQPGIQTVTASASTIVVLNQLGDISPPGSSDGPAFHQRDLTISSSIGKTYASMTNLLTPPRLLLLMRQLMVCLSII